MLKRVQILLGICMLMFAFSASAETVTVKAFKENKAQKKANKECSKKSGHGYSGANSVKCVSNCGKKLKRGTWKATCKKSNSSAQNNPGGSCVYGSSAWKIKALNQQRAQQKANNRCRRANSASAQTVQCIKNCDRGALKRKEYCYKCSGAGSGSSGSGSSGSGSYGSGSSGSGSSGSGSSGSGVSTGSDKLDAAISAKKCKSGEISFKSGKRTAKKEGERKCRRKQKKGLSKVYNIGGRNFCAVCDGGTTYKSGDANKLCKGKGFFGGIYKKSNKKKRVEKKAHKTCQKANLNSAKDIQNFTSIKNRKNQVLWCYNCYGTDEGGNGVGAGGSGDSGKVNVREATKVCMAKGYDGGAVARKIGAAQREANRNCMKAGKGGSQNETCVRNCNQKNKKKIFCFKCGNSSKKDYKTAKCSGLMYSLKKVGSSWTCKHKKKNKTKTPKCKKRYSFDSKAASAGQTCYR